MKDEQAKSLVEQAKETPSNSRRRRRATREEFELCMALASGDVTNSQVAAVIKISDTNINRWIAFVLMAAINNGWLSTSEGGK